MRSLIPLTLALLCASALAREPKEKPLGRSMQQRFNSTMEEQQALVFDTRQGSVGGARSFEAGSAQTKSFQANQAVVSPTYETGKAPTKKSWFGNFKFGTKSADVGKKSEVSGANAAFTTKSAATRNASGFEKTAAVNEVSGTNREYLGPERKKLDRAIDPGKPLPGWAGDKLDVMTLEQIRELLNKNK